MKKNNSLKVAIILVLLGTSIGLFAQNKEEKERVYHIMPYLSYGYDFSMADMKDRFGNNFGLHGGMDLVYKNNISLGMFLKYKFGDKLKEDVLHEMRLDNGEILANGGAYANVVMNERVIYTGLQVGKVFPLAVDKKNIDIKIDFGIGYLSHYVYIANSFEDVPQLIGDLTKGYDRLTNGFGLNQAVSIHYVAMNNWRLVLSIESIQGFTSLARNLQYDVPQTKLNNRLDVMTGIHLGFVLPFGFGSYGEEVFY